MKKNFLNLFAGHSKTGKRNPNRQMKDRLFRFLFDQDREALLQLYNALNGSSHEDASALQIVTIESAVYVVMKNDLAFILTGTINLYEHQSTINPNMPVRFMIYLAKEYQMYIAAVKESLYGTKQISLPTPCCVVFYNGDMEMPEEKILKLSDSFQHRKENPDVELTVRVLNINLGHNTELMKKCPLLEEYARFVAVTKEYMSGMKNYKSALDKAITYCIEHHILENFLRTYRGEVLGMLLEEFDVEKYERTLRNEGWESGYESAKSKWFEIGRSEGLETGRSKWLEIGKSEGLEIGKYEKLIMLVSKKKARNISPEETAKILEEDPRLITTIYNALDKYDVETQLDKIIALL